MSDLLWEMPTTTAKVYYLMVVERLPVFPCLNIPDDPHRDKTPRYTGSFYNASHDPEDIELVRWDQESYLIGVPTGPVTGLAILDIDPRHGGDSWYAAHQSRLPETRIHRTGGGGLHLLFRVQDGAIRNTASKIAPGVDTRGDGGYFIFWPAHPERGGALVHDVPLDELPPWPSWIVLPEKKTNPLRHDGGGGDWYAAASPNRINRLIERVRNEPEGNRNELLFWAACRIGEIGFERGTQRDRTLNRLLDAAIAAGLDPDRAAATIESGLRPERRRGGA